jgi:hypothetical protein
MYFPNQQERLSLASLSSQVYCLWSRPGAYPRAEHLKGSSIGVDSCFTNQHLAKLERLQEANTLAYHERS